MPRATRCILPGVPYHITQRGVDRRSTFCTDDDRTTYLKLLKDNLADASVRILAWCLMINHVHLIAVPEREDSLAVATRRVHGRYAQYFNVRYGRIGHLWQNRYFACALGQSHLWRAVAYVEVNPVRAGLVKRAADYRWSSAGAHVHGHDETGLLDMAWWQDEGPVGPQWQESLGPGSSDSAPELRRCTYAGRPYGEESFLEQMSARFGRHWKRGRPAKRSQSHDDGRESGAREIPLVT